MRIALTDGISRHFKIIDKIKNMLDDNITMHITHFNAEILSRNIVIENDEQPASDNKYSNVMKPDYKVQHPDPQERVTMKRTRERM